MKPIMPVLVSFIFILLQSSASAVENWVSFQSFPYFVSGTEACSDEGMEFVLSQLRSQGRREAELTKFKDDFYLKLQSHDVIRPFVSEKDVFVGVNNRWVSVAPGCANLLLQCNADQSNGCKEISSFPNSQVVTVLLFNEGRIVAKRETYAADVLNFPEKTDFILSGDGGKSWAEIRTPVPVCEGRGSVCELIPISFSKYYLIATKLNAEENGFDEVLIHSTSDGGKTWFVSMDKWKGVNSSVWISLGKATMVSIPASQRHVISISEYDLSSRGTKNFQTSLPPDNWDYPNPGVVIKRDAEYFVQLNNLVPNGGGGSFSPQTGDYVESGKACLDIGNGAG